MEETTTSPVKEDEPVKGDAPAKGETAVNESAPVREGIPGKTDAPVNKKPGRAWYAVYTNSRAEKRVSDRITEMGIETFLPLQKTLRQWSDRRKLIEKPLISSYVFVRAVPKEFFPIRTTDGVVKFIMIQGKPVAIPEQQITNLRILCGSDADVEVSSDVYAKGDMVEVIVGSLTGLKGELIRVGRKHKVVIRIIQPGMNLTVDIKTNAIRKLEKK
ncbi:MAG: UpxY family transcription antiterminator [Bacteroidales bacterium]